MKRSGRVCNFFKFRGFRGSCAERSTRDSSYAIQEPMTCADAVESQDSKKVDSGRGGRPRNGEAAQRELRFCSCEINNE